ncbi:hypothetical protein SAMN05216232_3536 [Virgibacillus subterraneus]|uniref:DUF4440 domain-containing protein n=1 Tax=Virgibacillus subterraneus TaxID=621109 RepID=A0A1H9JMH5_9BACI|nr:hypothetical protein [Virgibacillus subterraneus]SEQ87795.1 hypothetical protein SAMN05216232_3536 [Virgibacillus subterraneus]
MGLEQEVSNEVYRLMELHQEFESGNYEEMNDLYSDEFQGWLYMPSLGQVEKFNLKDIKEGNEEAANHFKLKKYSSFFQD